MKSIRKIRKEKKLTLEDLSLKTGYTIGYLSQLERQLRTPTLNTLRKIAFAFDLDVTDLLYDYESEENESVQQITDSYQVVRKEERSILYIDELDLTYEIILKNNKYENKKKVTVCKLKPGELGTGDMVRHTSDEFIFVQKGEMYCVVRNEKVKLSEGDSMLIPAGNPHMFKNTSESIAEVLMITF